MRTLIVEDNVIVADHLRQIVEEIGGVVVGLARCFDQAMHLMSQKPELALVDIQLQGEKNGLEVMHKLSANGCLCIVVTANNDRAFIRQAAQMSPVAYLTKPFNRPDIIAALELARYARNKTSGYDAVQVTTPGGTRSIPVSEVQYVRADNVYVNVVTDSRIYVHRSSLADFAQAHGCSSLVRVHRSFLVNRDRVQLRRAGYVVIEGEKIPVSRTYKGALDR